MKYPKAIQSLIDQFSKLPSVGPKTAERYVFYLLRQDIEMLQQFAQAMAELKEQIVVCKNCFSVSTSDPCQICTDKNRRKDLVCVVAGFRDLLAIESTGQYNGLYLVLGGTINAIEGINPDQLNINPLIEKVRTHQIKEVILALNPDLEGETTSLYLSRLLKPFKSKVTRLAKGLPMGADLEYADEITLINALKYRNEL